MAEHDEFRILAIELIEAEGRTITLRELSAAAGDPNKPWNGPGVPTAVRTVAVHGVFVPAAGSSLGRNITTDELLKEVEQIALVEPSEEGLERMHQIVDGGTIWKVEWAQVLKPADVTLLYLFGVKR